MALKHLTIVMLVVFSTSITSLAQSQSNRIKPQWMRSLPKVHNSSFVFSSIVSSGSNLDELRTKSLSDLAADLGLEKGVTAVSSYKSSESELSSINAGKMSSNGTSEFEFHSTIDGKPVSFNAKIIDEYWVKTSSGDILMTTLYAHSSVDSRANFDPIRVTDKYANEPITWALSLIPGAAQMHKGDYLKGGLIMGGAVAMAGGLVAFESMRANYLAKIGQTHSADVKVAYNNKAGTCATMRNIFIGGLAALYVYNILDAFIAPGARRIIIMPTTLPNEKVGLSLSYKF